MQRYLGRWGAKLRRPRRSLPRSFGKGKRAIAAVGIAMTTLTVGEKIWGRFSQAKSSEGRKSESRGVLEAIEQCLSACVTIHVAHTFPTAAVEATHSSSSSSSPPQRQRRPRGVLGRGSGFLITSEGHLLTNAHVVLPSSRYRAKGGGGGSGPSLKSEIVVTLFDGRFFPAEVLAIDRGRDVALLKISTLMSGKKEEQQPDLLEIGVDSFSSRRRVKEDDLFPCIRMAPSSKLAAGSPVLSIASSLFESTVREGIVSGFVFTPSNTAFPSGYDSDSRVQDMELIQVDSIGNVVGISTLILDSTLHGKTKNNNNNNQNGNNNTGDVGERISELMKNVGMRKSLAIPSDEIRVALDNWKHLFGSQQREGRIEAKVATRPRKSLGISVVTLTPSMISKEMLTDSSFPNVRRGLLVTNVESGSAADSAGIRSGDVISLINNRQASRTSQLENLVRARSLWCEDESWSPQCGHDLEPRNKSASTSREKNSCDDGIRLGVVRKEGTHTNVLDIRVWQ